MPSHYFIQIKLESGVRIMDEKKMEKNKIFEELELYAEELPEITTTFGTSTMSTESSVLSASCPTSSASTYTTMSSFSW